MAVAERILIFFLGTLLDCLERANITLDNGGAAALCHFLAHDQDDVLVDAFRIHKLEE